MAAIERMSIRPEPSEPPLLLIPGRGKLAAGELEGCASASRLDSEKSTEFSWRWPVRPPPAAPLPWLWRPPPDSIWAPAEPNENEGEGAGSGAAAGEANRSALGPELT